MEKVKIVLAYQKKKSTEIYMTCIEEETYLFNMCECLIHHYGDDEFAKKLFEHGTIQRLQPTIEETEKRPVRNYGPFHSHLELLNFAAHYEKDIVFLFDANIEEGEYLGEPWLINTIANGSFRFEPVYELLLLTGNYIAADADEERKNAIFRDVEKQFGKIMFSYIIYK